MRRGLPRRLEALILLFFLMGAAALYGADITLAWDPNSQTPLSGYRIYYGVSTRSYGLPIDVGNRTTYTIRNLASGYYCFAVTAYDPSGNESGYSNEVCTTISNGQPMDTGAFALAIAGPDSEQHTGMSIANIGPTEANLALTAYSPEGIPVTGAGVTNPAFVTLAPGQQMPAVDAQLFSASGPLAGWVQVGTAPAITGYFTVFNSALSILDGVLVSNADVTSFVLPEIENQGSTQIRVANPGDAAALLNFSLIDGDGSVLGYAARIVNSRGSTVESFADLFPGLAPVSSGYLLVTTEKGVIPLELLGKPAGDIRMINGLDAEGGGTVLYAPQYAVGGGWRSWVSVINLDSTGGMVTFRLRGSDGAVMGEARSFPIAPRGKIHLDAADYFGDSGSSTIQGYLEVISNGIRIAGSVTFADPDGLTHAAALPLVTNLVNSLAFPHVASDDTYFTGLAILNPGEAPARATLSVYAADGTGIASVEVDIPARGRACRLLTEYLPALAGLKLDSGYMTVTADSGIAAFALFGTRNLSAIAALSAYPSPQ